MRLETGLRMGSARTFMFSYFNYHKTSFVTVQEKHSPSFPDSFIPSPGNEVQEEKYKSGIGLLTVPFSNEGREGRLSRTRAMKRGPRQ